MRHIFLLILAIAVTGAKAQDTVVEYLVPELPVVQLCAVEEGSEVPVPFASITVEYVDSIVKSTTDEMGLLDFTPLSFPLTVTAAGEGMIDSTYALMSHPEEPLVILMAREPAEKENGAVAMIRNFIKFRNEADRSSGAIQIVSAPPSAIVSSPLDRMLQRSLSDQANLAPCKDR